MKTSRSLLRCSTGSPALPALTLSPPRQRGAAMVEFVVVLPALLLLGLGTLQSTLFYQAKTSVSYATFEAARKGAVNHAQRATMLDEFGIRVAPVFGGDGDAASALSAMRKGKTEANDNNITQIDIINPTQEAFDDFDDPATDEVDIPNVHLRYRDASEIKTAGVNIQDANLLKIKTTYGYELKVPLISTVLPKALKLIDADNAKYYDDNRIPITAVATVRMQSEAWKDGNLKADGSAPTGSDGTNNDPGEPDPLEQGDPIGSTGGNGCGANQSCVDQPTPPETGGPACPATGSDTASNQTTQKSSLPGRFTGNPINIISGNKYQLETDVPALPGPLGLVWQRHYNSQSPARTTLGAGWRHSYDVKATATDNGISVVQADGRQLLFEETEPGHYASPLKGDGWLTRAPDPNVGGEDRLTWHWRNGQTLRFNERGQLTKISLPTGDAVRLEYNDQHRLFIVRDAQQRALNLAYYPNGRLKQVLDPTGQALRYRYGKHGTLQSVTYADDTTRQYHYEDKHDATNLTGLTDQRGIRFATWEYDENDRAISSEHANGVEKVTLAYNDDGSRLITNSLGETSTYYTETRNGTGIVTAIAGPGCSSCDQGDTQYEYNDDLQLIRGTNKDGMATLREYDEQGRTTVLSQVSPDGQTSEVARYEYAGDESNLPSKIKKPSVKADAHHEIALSYNAANQITKMSESGWSPTSNGAFEAIERQVELIYTEGFLTEIDGPRNDIEDITHLRYADDRRVRQVTTADGTAHNVLERDRYGRVMTMQSGTAAPQHYTYDPEGRLTKMAQAGSAIRFDYNATGKLQRIRHPDGSAEVRDYDDAGRLVKQTDGRGRGLTQHYDDKSRVVSYERLGINSEVLSWLNSSYDVAGNLQTLSSNLNATLQFAYDDTRRVTEITAADEPLLSVSWSGTTQASTLTQPDGGVTRLAYNRRGDTSWVTDARDNPSQYQYDDFGRVVGISNPDAGSRHISYDGNDNQLNDTRDASGEIRYEYDAVNRLTRVQGDDGLDYTLSYRSDTVTGLASDAVNERREVNASNQVVTRELTYGSQRFSQAYTYDEQGRLSEKTLFDGSTLEYIYTATGEVASIVRKSGLWRTDLVSAMNTSADTATDKTVELGNGLTEQYSYEDSRLASLYVDEILNLDYEYDEQGRIVHIVRDQQPQNYSYDALGRLTSAEQGDTRYAYNYDAVGNRVAQTINRQKQKYEYVGEGMGNTLRETPTADSVRHNDAGSVVRAGELRYEYDTRQRPLRVYQNEKLLAEYRYNLWGERISKTLHNDEKKETRYYLYENRRLVAEADHNGNITQQYVYIDESAPQPLTQPEIRRRLHQQTVTKPRDFREPLANEKLSVKGILAEVTNVAPDIPVANDYPFKQPDTAHQNLLAVVSEGDVYWAHTDHLGTPHALSGKRGDLVWQADYSPFGEAKTRGDLSFNLRYPGQYYDEETATHYNYQRDYDPATGRYLTVDPLDLRVGLNNYSYAANDPVAYTDPTGEAVPAIVIACGANPACVAALVRTGQVAITAIVGYLASLGILEAVMDMVNGEEDTPEECEVEVTPGDPTPGRDEEECARLNAEVQAAKGVVGSFHPAKCKVGMTFYQLIHRREAWLREASARARRDEKCWSGGDELHQEEQAKAWQHVGTCTSIMQQPTP